MISRAVDVSTIDGISLRLCSPEDLIVLKSFAARDIDWRDVETVIYRQTPDKLDSEYIFKHLRLLADLKEEPELVAHLKTIFSRGFSVAHLRE